MPVCTQTKQKPDYVNGKNWSQMLSPLDLFQLPTAHYECGSNTGIFTSRTFYIPTAKYPGLELWHVAVWNVKYVASNGSDSGKQWKQMNVGLEFPKRVQVTGSKIYFRLIEGLYERYQSTYLTSPLFIHLSGYLKNWGLLVISVLWSGHKHN